MSSPTLPSDVARRSLAREHGLLTAPRIGARAAHGGPARSRGSALHPVPCAAEAPDASLGGPSRVCGASGRQA